MKKEKIKRYICFFLAINLLFEVISPTMALALTSGPIQPEFTSFEPASSSEMVDIFSGDFKYNIPLMEIEGYPINLNYHAGANMEEEASWVGLGWGLNTGALNRTMRGLPDDFSGDQIESIHHVKPQITFGVGGSYTSNNNSTVSYSSFPATVGFGWGVGIGTAIMYNNYKGFGIEQHVDGNLSISLSLSMNGQNGGAGMGVYGGVGGGISLNSLEGSSVSYGSNFGISLNASKGGVSGGLGLNFGQSTTINTRTGATYQTYSSGITASGGYSKDVSEYSAKLDKVLNAKLEKKMKEEGKQMSKEDGLHAPSVASASGGTSMSSSVTYPTSSIGFSPTLKNDMVSAGFSLSNKFGFYSCVGFSFYGWNFTVENGRYLGMDGMFSISSIINSNKSRSGYGYLNEQNANLGDDVALDFNRYNDGPFYRETPNAPMSQNTYDLYTATAQGLYSSFRSQRSDLGVVYDPGAKLYGGSAGLANEFGFGAISHMMMAFNTSFTYGKSGLWRTDLIGLGTNYFQKDINNLSQTSYEPSYFKEMGENTAVDKSFNQKINDDVVVTPVPGYVSPVYYKAVSTLTGASSAPSNQGAITRGQRNIRQNNISYLTADQANAYGYEKKIFIYPINSFNLDCNNAVGASEALDRRYIDSKPVGHHLSEITVNPTNGFRYVYGIPVYNKIKKEVMFNASKKQFNLDGYFNPSQSPDYLNTNSWEMVNYIPGTDNSENNRRGVDHLYDSKTTPAYAQSFLLSSILSTSYIDRTNNGPSEDDYGNYTKFNYSKVGDYGWRAPYGQAAGGNWALLDKGLIADQLDDKGFYEYGRKELWYVHSIETKNFVAEFYIDPRRDGMGVDDENGNTSPATTHSYKLSRIKLFSKREKKRAQATGTPAVPIKVVYFEYDYSLCKNVPNNDHQPDNVTQLDGSVKNINTDYGKLTLKRVYITYGNSRKGFHTPYEFVYADADHDGTPDSPGTGANPAYDPKSVDRWGTYKPNNGFATGDVGLLSNPNNDEYPYSNQNKDQANTHSASWNISTIYSPTGSKTNIDYEADDYGYVQNEVAAQMLKIKDLLPSIALFNPASTGNTSIVNTNYAIIDLSGLAQGISISTSASDANDIVRKQLFKNSKDLYFKCFTNATTFAGQTFWEYIPGYADIDTDDAGVINNNGSAYVYNDPVTGQTNYKYAYIKIKTDGLNDDGSGPQVSPICKAGWQFLRSYVPRVAYPGSEPANSGNSLLQKLNLIKTGLGTSLTDLVNAFKKKPNDRFYSKKYCNQINYNKSWVRAYSPFKSKVGGGHRVKQIVISDQWNNMTYDSNSNQSESISYYGQEYSYKTIDENGKQISSGVASYEPLSGGDEISLRKKIEYHIKQRMAPHDHYFQEDPLGEMMYPNPLVGYSKVSIKQLSKDEAYNTNQNYSIGKTEYEFYTAKDFPVVTVNSGCNKPLIHHDPIDEFTLIKSYTNILHAFQGYVIKLNNMHGKLKAQSMYSQTDLDSPISSTKYFYKQTSVGANGSAQLQNSVKTIDQNLVIRDEVIGREIDLTTDLRESVSSNINMGFSISFDLSLCLSSPLGFGFDLSFQNMGFRSAVMTKVVQNYGIVDRVETYNNNVKSVTQNLLWDRNTGDVVLTSMKNDSFEPIYNFGYPAYWMYPDMGGAYQRQNFIIKVAPGSGIWNYSTGELDVSQIGNYLKPGDEVRIYSNNIPSSTLPVTTFANGEKSIRAWVYKDPLSDVYRLIDDNGVTVVNGYLGLSVSANNYIQVVRTSERNLNMLAAGNVASLTNPLNTSTNQIDLSQNVLTASAQEYCNNWNMFYENDPANEVYCNITENGEVNPYVIGYTGNWMLWRSFNYNTTRNYNTTQPNKKQDGVFSDYAPFWAINITNNKWEPIYTDHHGASSYGKWVSGGEKTMFLPNGKNIESKDALGNFSASVYSFNQEILKATATNARYSEIAFESFEEYTNYTNKELFCLGNCDIKANDHMNVVKSINLGVGTSSFPNLEKSIAHTGRQSLRFNTGHIFKIDHKLNNPIANTVLPKLNLTCSSSNTAAIEKLNLGNGVYLAAFWVKGDERLDDFSSLFEYKIRVNGSVIPFTSVVKSKVINGWQKYEYTFSTSAASGSIDFSVKALGNIYLDDYRIQPFNSTMICYVHDPYQLRLWAQLDDRNYATIMEYDNEGGLVRTKKETEKGIFTISETRNSIIKK